MKDVPVWKVGESVYNFGRWMPPATTELCPDVCVIPPWSNLWLVGSIVLTMLLHILILYVRPLSILFSVTPLSWAEWTVVLYLSFPAKKPGKATIKVVSNFDPFNYDENEDGTKVEYRMALLRGLVDNPYWCMKKNFHFCVELI